MKKFRGQRRYYSNLKRDINNFQFNLSENEWYNLWHTHLDFRGYSNYSAKHHRRHIVLLLELFKKVLDYAKESPVSYQTWIYINKEDGSQDAIYFHTKNPYSEFPINFSEVVWGTKVPDFLTGLIDLNVYDLGYANFSSGESYIVKSKNQGEPL